MRLKRITAMAGVGLGAVAMEWINSETGGKRESVEALKNGPAEGKAPPLPLCDQCRKMDSLDMQL